MSDKKPVGKKAEPTFEELEFMYSHIEDGLPNQEILEEMQEESYYCKKPGEAFQGRKP